MILHMHRALSCSPWLWRPYKIEKWSLIYTTSDLILWLLCSCSFLFFCLFVLLTNTPTVSGLWYFKSYAHAYKVLILPITDDSCLSIFVSPQIMPNILVTLSEQSNRRKTVDEHSIVWRLWKCQKCSIPYPAL